MTRCAALLAGADVSEFFRAGRGGEIDLESIVNCRPYARRPSDTRKIGRLYFMYLAEPVSGDFSPEQAVVGWPGTSYQAHFWAPQTTRSGWPTGRPSLRHYAKQHAPPERHLVSKGLISGVGLSLFVRLRRSPAHHTGDNLPTRGQMRTRPQG